MAVNICIFTNSKDSHADKVIPLLEKRGITAVKFSTDLISDKQYLEVSEKSLDVKMYYNRKIYYPHDFSVIWYRKPEQWWRFFDKQREMEELDIIRFKAKETNHPALNFMHRCRKLNIPIICNPFDDFAAEDKINQLIIAQKLGFSIPRTLISSNAETIRKFIKSNDQTVIKTLKNPQLQAITLGIFTFLLTLEKFNELEKKSPLDYPLFLQENIKKISELRITVVGDKVFTACLDSQKNKFSRIDWRTIDPEFIPHGKFTLPKKIEKMCISLLKELKLNFGTIDMAITPDDRYIFFEINPFGQYQWIEDLTGLPISRGMADLIIKLAERKS